MMAFAVDADVHAVMRESIRVHARADAGLVEQIHRNLFDDAGANATEHVIGGLPFQDYVADAPFVEQLAEQ
jgi:hypothetical protein